MTYKFDLERDFEAAPFIDGLGTAVIEFALGYDLERHKVIVMSVLLVRGDSYLEGKIANVFDTIYDQFRDATSGIDYWLFGPAAIETDTRRA
jgi:hypothetical protein